MFGKYVWLYFSQSGLRKESNNAKVLSKLSKSRLCGNKKVTNHTVEAVAWPSQVSIIIWYALAHKWIDNCNQSCVKDLTATEVPPYFKG